jgi:lipid A 4'-phosphatase
LTLKLKRAHSLKSNMAAFIQKHKGWLIPIVVMAIFTPFSANLDLVVAKYFYGQSNEVYAHFAHNAFYKFVYTYGVYPAQIVAILAAIALILSYCSDRWKAWRLPALVLLLTMIVGAGLIVHSLLKDHWGRPRPKQTIEFGGNLPFRPYYNPNIFHQSEPAKSFPCGHCTMGFYFFAVALVGKRLNSKLLFYGGMGIAIVLGIALSITRMAQGGHYLSDTLMTALIMWLTAYASDWLVYSKLRMSFINERTH